MAATLLVIVASLLVGVSAQTELTGCQKCAAPGGDCSKAYKQEPGKHCGDVSGSPFCCPNTHQCFHCNNAYRCYPGIRPDSNICATEGGNAGVSPSSGRVPVQHESNDLITLLIILVLVFAVGSSLSACMRARRQTPMAGQGAVTGVNMMQMGTMPVQGKPGQPMHAVAGMPVGTAVPGQPVMMQSHPGYPVQQGYGGGSVAMGAGMGFLGGMMVGEMLSDHGHYGGDYSGGYGGDMGGDMGGDFAADM